MPIFLGCFLIRKGIIPNFIESACRRNDITFISCRVRTSSDEASCRYSKMGDALPDDVVRDVPIADGEEETTGIKSESEHGEVVIHMQQNRGKSLIFPPQYQFILKESDTAIAEDDLTEENLYRLLHDGIYLNQKRKKFWVDKNGKNCFMLYARGLAITWADTSNYWRWIYLKDTPGEDLIEAAELVDVCWLEARARLLMSVLSPQTTYRVAFVLMIRAPGYGWHVPVNFKLVLPDKSPQELKERLDKKPREKWFEVTAGEIMTRGNSDATTSGEMEISMLEILGGHWKSGMVIKGVVIRPKE